MRKFFIVTLFLILVYTRFVGINWGLPYPMHPDERNMAESVTQITLVKPYSPSFWAYRGFQINTAHFFIFLKKILFTQSSRNFEFLESIVMLRFISAMFSILTVYFGLKIIKLFERDNFYIRFLSLLLLIFSPALIQMAHFGTTESSVSFFYTGIIYCSILILQKKEKKTIFSELFIIALFLGMAAATKITAILFILVPLVAIIFMNIKKWKKKRLLFLRDTLIQGTILLFLVSFFSVIFSPHYLLYFKDFVRSLQYERALVSGQVAVFYTRQFFKTYPVLFQLNHIFPYMLGLPVFVCSVLGFIFASWKKAEINLLRFAFLLYFIPTAFLYTKWARYMTPIIPVMIVFAVLFFSSIYGYLSNLRSKQQFKSLNLTLNILILILIIPGIAYLSIYQNSDVRFYASEWIFNNIPRESNILSETANVIDVPLRAPSAKIRPVNYNLIGFNFYDLDFDKKLQQDLQEHLLRADYIFIPSRRIFMNHGCLEENQISNVKYINERCMKLKETYPLVNEYYQKLFSGNLGFKQIAEITSYPRIEFLGKTIIEFPDEEAEETWTVFDHPVIRIYKGI